MGGRRGEGGRGGVGLVGGGEGGKKERGVSRTQMRLTDKLSIGTRFRP